MRTFADLQIVSRREHRLLATLDGIDIDISQMVEAVFSANKSEANVICQLQRKAH